MPDAIVLLKEDHKQIKRLFKEFEQLGDNAKVTKRKLVDQVLALLAVHTAIEEKHFYPAIQQLDEVEDIVKEGYEEHHAADRTMDELRTLDVEADNFDAKVTVLMEMVRHHIEEEEQDMFPKVREAMGRNALQELGEVMEQAKQAEPYPDSPAPRTKTADQTS